MCGIVGYHGREEARDILIDALRRLEYRGYDSAGIAISQDGSVKIARKQGKVSDLWNAICNENFEGSMGLAHTRERDYLIEESLVALEQEFPQRFVRVHRNCLVARRAISGFERAQGEEAESHWLVLLNGLAEKLPVSRRQWPALKGSLAAAARAER